MSKCNRINILVVDKKNVYMDKFRGLRKNKFLVNAVENIYKQSTIKLDDVDVFFLVLYSYRDVIQLLILANHPNIIIGTENTNILKSMRVLNGYKVIDLTSRFDLFSVLSSIKTI